MVESRRPVRLPVVLVAALGVGLGVTGCSGGSGASHPSASGAASVIPSEAPNGAGQNLVVASAATPQDVLLGELYAGALRAKGVRVLMKPGVGGRAAYIAQLQDGSVDLVPEYTGALLTHYDSTTTAAAPDEVYGALPRVLPAPLTVLDKAAAQERLTVAVTRAVADAHQLHAVADLAAVAGRLTLAAGPGFATRPDGARALTRTYGVTFGKVTTADDAGPATVAALTSGAAQVGLLHAGDPALTAGTLVALDDPKSVFLAQNVVPLINKAKVDPTVSGTLNAVSAKLDTATLAALVLKVTRSKADPVAVAREWLTGQRLA